jgi:murein DD-endopeptidase MepM/ murein hydrolase activator NlpD
MSRVKYFYDPETLSYREIKKNTSTRLKLFFGFILSSLSFGFLIVFVSSFFLESPNEKALKRELDNMQLQYTFLNQKLSEIEEVLSNIEERDNSIYRLYFEANPIPEAQRLQGFGGVNRYKKFEGFKNSDLIMSSNKRLEILQKRIVVQSKSLDEITKLAKDKENFLSRIPAIQPIKNEDLTRMASGYGYRNDPFTKTLKFHSGMDFTSPRGTPVYATGDGIVKRADSGSSGYGRHIRIDHGYGYISLYAHLYKYNVVPNQQVKRGQIIGFVGSSGRSQAPHLHYEIIKDGNKINPLNFYYGNLTKDEFNNLLKKASTENQSLD